MAGGGEKSFFVDGGIAQMKDNKLTVLTTEAKRSDEIDIEAARAEFNEATARNATDEKGFEDRQRKLQRGRVMEQFASRR